MDTDLATATLSDFRFLSERHIAHPTVRDFAMELAAMELAAWAVKSAGYDVREAEAC